MYSKSTSGSCATGAGGLPEIWLALYSSHTANPAHWPRPLSDRSLYSRYQIWCPLSGSADSHSVCCHHVPWLQVSLQSRETHPPLLPAQVRAPPTSSFPTQSVTPPLPCHPSSSSIKELEKIFVGLVRSENGDIRQKGDPARLPISQCQLVVVNGFTTPTSEIGDAPLTQVRTNTLLSPPPPLHSLDLLSTRSSPPMSVPLSTPSQPICW